MVLVHFRENFFLTVQKKFFSEKEGICQFTSKNRVQTVSRTRRWQRGIENKDMKIKKICDQESDPVGE